MMASFSGQKEIVQYLFENGANINHQNKVNYVENFNNRLLHLSCMTTLYQEGATALMVIAQKDNIDIVQYLVEKGSDLNLQSNVILQLF